MQNREHTELKELLNIKLFHKEEKKETVATVASEETKSIENERFENIIERTIKSLENYLRPEDLKKFKRCLIKLCSYESVLTEDGSSSTNLNNLKILLKKFEAATKTPPVHITGVINDLREALSELSYDLNYDTALPLFETAFTALGQTTARYALHKGIQTKARASLAFGTRTYRRIADLANHFYKNKIGDEKLQTVNLTEHMYKPAMFIHPKNFTLTQHEAKAFLEEKNTADFVISFLQEFIGCFEKNLRGPITIEKAKDFLKQLWAHIDITEGLDQEEIDRLFDLSFTINVKKQHQEAKGPSTFVEEPDTYSLQKTKLLGPLFLSMIQSKYIRTEAFVPIKAKDSKDTFYLLPDDLALSWVSIKSEKKSKNPTRRLLTEHFKSLTPEEQLYFLKQLILLRSDQLSAIKIQNMISALIHSLRAPNQGKIPSFAKLKITLTECENIQPGVLLWFGLRNDTTATSSILETTTGTQIDKQLIPSYVLRKFINEGEKKLPALNNEHECLTEIIWTKELFMDCYEAGIRHFSGKFIDLDLSEVDSDLSDVSFKGAIFHNVTFINDIGRKFPIQGVKFAGAQICDQYTFEQLIKADVQNFDGATLGKPLSSDDYKSTTEEFKYAPEGINLRNFTGKSLSFNGATLIKPDMKDANITNFQFQAAKLDRPNLENATATGWITYSRDIFYNAEFKGANLKNFKVDHRFDSYLKLSSGLHAKMDYKSLESFLGGRPKNLRDITFVAKDDDEKGQFRDLDLCHSQLSGKQIRQLVSFERNNFKDLDISNTSFWYDRRRHDDPVETLLFHKDTDFKGSNLEGTDFCYTDLTHVSFRGALLGDYDKTDFSRSIFKGLFKTQHDHNNYLKKYDYLSKGHGGNAVETLKNLLNLVYLENNEKPKDTPRDGLFSHKRWDYFYSGEWNRLKHVRWRHYTEEVELLLTTLQTEEKSGGPAEPLTMVQQIENIKNKLGDAVKTGMATQGGELHDIFAFCENLAAIEDTQNQKKNVVELK